MSLNISRHVLRVAEAVDVTIDVDALPTRTRNELNRMVQTGMVKGRGKTAILARAVLDAYKLPYIQVQRSYAHFDRIPLDPEHPLRKFLIEQNAIATLMNETSYYNPKQQERRAKEADRDWIWVEHDSAETCSKLIAAQNVVKLEGVVTFTLFQKGDPMP